MSAGFLTASQAMENLSSSFGTKLHAALIRRASFIEKAVKAPDHLSSGRIVFEQGPASSTLFTKLSAGRFC